MKAGLIIIFPAFLQFSIPFALHSQGSSDSTSRAADTTNPPVALSESVDLFTGIDLFALFNYESYVKPAVGINVAGRSNYLLRFVDQDFSFYENYQIFPPGYPFYSNLNLLLSLENNAPLFKGINFYIGYLLSQNNRENEFLLHIEKKDRAFDKEVRFQKQYFMKFQSSSGIPEECAYHTYNLAFNLKKKRCRRPSLVKQNCIPGGHSGV